LTKRALQVERLIQPLKLSKRLSSDKQKKLNKCLSNKTEWSKELQQQICDETGLDPRKAYKHFYDRKIRKRRRTDLKEAMCI
jgi:hypothetical protein